MKQRNAIIMWAKSSEEDYQITLKKASSLLYALRKFGPEIAPNYITSLRKRDALAYDWNTITLDELLKKGVNREGKKQFLDLGYRISFFSSLKEEESAGIRLLLGASNPIVNNCFIVNLPLTLPIYENSETRENLITTFKECIRIFDPFWACISNAVNIRRFEGYWGDEIPTAIHWVNYFGNEIAYKIGEEKILTTPNANIEKYQSGYIIKIKEDPIDDESYSDLELQNTTSRYLGLK